MLACIDIASLRSWWVKAVPARRTARIRGRTRGERGAPGVVEVGGGRRLPVQAAAPERRQTEPSTRSPALPVRARDAAVRGSGRNVVIAGSM
jgi:hypothetical protein